jgi:hypothetical protein
MSNPFTAALSKIGAGVKFLASHVWAGLKAVFGQNAKDVSLAALKSAQELLKTEAGQFIQKVVQELEASALGGPERLAQATAEIKAYLVAQGKELPTVWIQWAIQTILVFLRGAVV